MDMQAALSGFSSVGLSLFFFIICISIIVTIHEFGHYIVGRWCGIHSEVFSLGFGKILYSRVDRHGTVWQLAAVPLGGFVKFLGDANAASVGGAVPTDADKRRTMIGAPLWARTLTVLAGPVFNFILSLLIFGSIFLFQGQASDPLTFDEGKALPASYTQELQSGDEILAINGQETPDLAGFGAYIDALPIEPVLDYTVLRDGAEITVQGPYPYPPMAAGLTPVSVAIKAGMEVGDVIISLDGVPVFAFAQLQEMFPAAEGAPIDAVVWRDGETYEVVLAPRRRDIPNADGEFETRWMVGLSGGLFFEPATERPSVWGAYKSGAQQVWLGLKSSLKAFKSVITGEISTCNLSGPVGLAEASGDMASQGFISFMWLVSAVSLGIGMMNLFPIPVLDGGHLVFYAYEAVRGKPPAAKIANFFMLTGLAIVGSFMLFTILNDLILCR